MDINQAKIEVKKNKKDEERGASLVEYALLIALIAVICIGAMTFLGQSISTRFSTIGSQIE